MSEQQPDISLDGEANEVVIIDSEDYRKTQKLKSIQETKDHYRETKRNKHSIEDELDEYLINPYETYNIQLVSAVVDYISELMPLIEEAQQSGTLTHSDLRVSLQSVDEEARITDIVRCHGDIQTSEGETRSIEPRDTTAVYRQGERIERMLGLGLELEEDKGPAQL